MSENSKIEWTDHTFNPWEGCTKVSPGCAHCYAETRNARFGGGTAPNWGKGAPRRRTSASNWNLPIKWNKAAGRDAYELAHTGKVTDQDGSIIPWHRPRVFCASLADWLDDEVPIEWLADLLDLIRRTPNLDWLLLTKRPENWRSRLNAAKHHMQVQSKAFEALRVFRWLSGNPPENVWIGTTVEDQARADERIPALLAIPAKVRFLSCEPLLEPVDLERAHRTKVKLPNWPAPTRVDWVITGGESGQRCRHFSADWARDLRDQCATAGVAFFMKQMGGERKPFAEIPDDLMIREFPGGKEGA